MAFNKKKKRGIVYERFSAEDKQENSIEIQRELIGKFAKQQDIEIIYEVADEGESGITANRPGFKKMFSDWILNPDAPDFDYVLVFDVSRWGRFQNGNEAAYYEFQCNQRGKQVIYVDDGMPRPEEQFMTQIKVSIQRGMAAEYSKKLSDKVFYGSAKVSEQGYSAGGTACYGMDRLLLDEQKTPVRRLKDGEHKAISNQRVTFVPKEDETSTTVKRIFDIFVNENKDLDELVKIANAEGAPPKKGGAWNKGKLLKILTNEIYVGTRIYNKTRSRLKTSKRKNDRDQWVVCINAFPQTVNEAVFWQAQEKLHWSHPSKWNRGVYAINKAWKMMLEEYIPALQELGLEKMTAIDALGDMPLLFAATYKPQNGLSHWCFLLEEEMRNRPYVLGVGVKVNQEFPIHKFFCFPSAIFGMGGSYIFCEKDEGYKKYELTEEQFKEKVIETVQGAEAPSTLFEERDPLVAVYEPTP